MAMCICVWIHAVKITKSACVWVMVIRDCPCHVPSSSIPHTQIHISIIFIDEASALRDVDAGVLPSTALKTGWHFFLATLWDAWCFTVVLIWWCYRDSPGPTKAAHLMPHTLPKTSRSMCKVVDNHLVISIFHQCKGMIEIFIQL